MWKKVRGLLIGAPKDVHSEHTFHSISLVAMLAWVGLGADGLSSSAYGPEAAFRELVAGGHDYTSLAVGLALGGGTYTGIEAVSNGVQIMREPKVRTAKNTMSLMATPLALTAGGIVLAYLLVHAMPADDKTMNAVLLERVTARWHVGGGNAGPAFHTVPPASVG